MGNRIKFLINGKLLYNRIYPVFGFLFDGVVAGLIFSITNHQTPNTKY